MLKKISSCLYQKSTIALTIVALIVFIFFSILFLPSQSIIANKYSQGLGSPDTSLFYTPADLYRMAEIYGIEGRAAYMRARWTFDLAFPIIYTFFLVTGISWFEKQVVKQDSELLKGHYIPLLAMFFDLLENTCVTLIFSSYPVYLSFVSMLAPFFTLMKWICVGSSFVLLVGLSIAHLVKIMQSKRQQP